MTRARASNLTDGDVERIVKLLDAWTGPLTWELFLKAAYRLTGYHYTRQALAKKSRIQAAFTRRQAAELVQGRPALTHAQRREAVIKTQREEIQRLGFENDALLEQFRRWLVNASIHGVTVDQLNSPLAPIDRPGKKRRGPVSENDI